MRTYLFFLLFLPMPFLSFLKPWIGMLIWGWLSLLNPHRDLWGFASTLPYNQIIAIATIAGWLLSGDRKAIRLDTTLSLIIALFGLATVSALLSLSPELTWPKWDEFGKTVIYIVFLGAFLTTKIRLHAFLWLIAVCIGFFGVKGAVLSILSGGSHQFSGPPGTQIQDRNELALAIVMVIPLLNYLRLHSAHIWVRRGLLLAMGFSVLAVVGTQSRGGFIALVATGVFLWLRARQKLATLIILLVAAILVLQLAPEAWRARVQTIESADERDASFQGRLIAWQTYWAAAVDRPFTGAGMRALNDASTFLHYMPYETGFDLEIKGAKAAHSIYFQVLGELGFVAFGVYLMIALIAMCQLHFVVRRSQESYHYQWLGDLARMLQVSLFGFFVGGAALSMALYDLYLMLIIVSSALMKQTLWADHGRPAWANLTVNRSISSGPEPKSA